MWVKALRSTVKPRLVLLEALVATVAFEAVGAVDVVIAVDKDDDD